MGIQGAIQQPAVPARARLQAGSIISNIGVPWSPSWIGGAFKAKTGVVWLAGGAQREYVGIVWACCNRKGKGTEPHQFKKSLINSARPTQASFTSHSELTQAGAVLGSHPAFPAAKRSGWGVLKPASSPASQQVAIASLHEQLTIPGSGCCPRCTACRGPRATIAKWAQAHLPRGRPRRGSRCTQGALQLGLPWQRAPLQGRGRKGCRQLGAFSAGRVAACLQPLRQHAGAHTGAPG